MPIQVVEVDPRELRPFPSRPQAEPWKLQRQISQYGASRVGLPPLEVYQSEDGFFVVYNGVTRATRMAMLSPGVKVRAEVIGRLRRKYASDPSIGDSIP